MREFYRDTMATLDRLGIDVAISAIPVRGPRPDPLRRGRAARDLCARAGVPLLADGAGDRHRLQGLPRTVHGQIEPRALLLGRVRPRRVPVLGTAHDAVAHRGLDHAVRLQRRTDERRLLARRPVDRRHLRGRPVLLRVRVPGTSRLPRRGGAPRRSRIRRAEGRVRAPLRGRPRRARSPADDPRLRGRARTSSARASWTGRSRLWNCTTEASQPRPLQSTHISAAGNARSRSTPIGFPHRTQTP